MTWLTELERLAREAQDTLCEYESGRGSQVWVQEALDCLHAEVPPARLLALIEVVYAAQNNEDFEAAPEVTDALRTLEETP